jgi:agmatine deiminase
MSTPKKTPAELGYRMPAEWEPQAAVWMSWPYNLQTWEDHLDGAENAFVEIIRNLTKHEHVNLLVANAKVRSRAEKKLAKAKIRKSNLQIHEIETGDIWFRDYGPLYITKNTIAGLRTRGSKIGSTDPQTKAYTKWLYNAYGNKYEDLLIGNEVPNKMPLQEFTRFDTNIILEGGSIDVNGTGTLITTESCLLSPDRNPHMTKKGIEQAIKDHLGITNVLWLSAGIEGDDTTGHVDDLTRFVDRSTVVTVVEEDENDTNYKPLMENAKRLKYMKDERGERLTVLTLPMPKPFYVGDRRMAASYANFLIANGIVLVPIYNQSSDKEALSTLRKCFPDRDVIGIDCRELIFGYGSIHCATMQEPA